MAAAAPRPYISFPGTAREALTFYQEVFGGELRLFTLAEFNRTDGPADAIAHGELTGLVSVGGSDAVGGEPTVKLEGFLLSLLGTAARCCTSGSARSRRAGGWSTRSRSSRGVPPTVRWSTVSGWPG